MIKKRKRGLWWKIPALISVLLFVAIAAKFGVAIWRIKTYEDMAKHPQELSLNDQAILEKSLDLRFPPDTIRICILSVHDYEAIIFMRIDIPSQSKEALLSSNLFSGARRDDSLLRLLENPGSYLHPPELYHIDWWNLREEKSETMNMVGLRLQNRNGIAVLVEDGDDNASVYVVRGSLIDKYQTEFISFMRSYPARYRSPLLRLIPSPVQGFSACWMLPAHSNR